MARSIGRRPKVVAAVRQRILSDWVLGRALWFRLPPEEKLAAEYRADPRTVRAALAELERECRVVRRPFGGIFVADWSAEVLSGAVGKSLGLCFYTPIGWLEDGFCRALLSGFFPLLSHARINLTVSTRVWRWYKPGAPLVDFASPEILGAVLVGRPPSNLLAELQALGKPLLAVDFDASSLGIDSFLFENAGAGALLARRLFRLGHRRVATVFEDPRKPPEKKDEAWSERQAGFVAHWAQTKAPPPMLIPLTNRGDFSPAEAALRDLFRLPQAERPTALLIPSEFMPQVQTWAALQRLRIPSQLTVMGFGGGLSQPRQPATKKELTRIAFDAQALGQSVVLHFLHLIRDPKWASRKVGVLRQKGYYLAGKTHARAP